MLDRPDRRGLGSVGRWIVAALLGACLFPGVRDLPLHAHDIPNDVTLRLFVRPDGSLLTVLVRVPLEALRDLDWPTRESGYLDLGRAAPLFRDASTLWITDNLEIFENGRTLTDPRLTAVRASLISDPSFGAYEDALAHIAGPPLPETTEIPWEQVLLDLRLEYPIDSDRSDFAIEPRFARLGLEVLTVVRFLPPGGADRAFELHGNPGRVPLDPRWHQAALLFVEEGFLHILDGIDHLLFLLCLVIPFRRFRPLVLIVTSFTVAHSITLIASAFGLAPGALWFPPLVEMLIAMSIVYMALENIVGASLSRRWIVTFAFGLVHGFGFSFALRDTLQFAGSHLVTSLLAFNVGVELGQLLVLVVAVPALGLLFRHVVAERLGTIILSVIVAHTAWHWMAERWTALQQFPAPEPNAALALAAMRWLMAALVLAGLLWLASLGVRYVEERRARRDAAFGAGEDF